MQTNEKPQHTPGPWKVSGTGQGLMISATFRPGYFACISGACEAAYGAEGEANARLIAAAPEMLAALRRISALCTRLTESQGYNEDGNADWLGPIAYEIAGAAFEATTKAQGAA